MSYHQDCSFWGGRRPHSIDRETDRALTVKLKFAYPLPPYSSSHFPTWHYSVSEGISYPSFFWDHRILTFCGNGTEALPYLVFLKVPFILSVSFHTAVQYISKVIGLSELFPSCDWNWKPIFSKQSICGFFAEKLLFFMVTFFFSCLSHFYDQVSSCFESTMLLQLQQM